MADKAISTTNHKPDFNPRSYARSDLLMPILIRALKYFNPRSYARSDLYSVISL